MMINGVRVHLAVDLPADDLTALVNKVKQAQADTHGYRLTDITVRAAADGGWDIDYDSKAPFDRIRRITGYLGTLDTWNDAKRAEVRDRVKHGLSED